MSEFELQQLFIATRWEFDLPTILIVVVSLAFAAVGTQSAGTIGKPGIRLLQVAYLFAAGFLFIRMQAAISRAARLTELMIAAKPSFRIASPTLRYPTLFFRYGSFVVLAVVTLLLLERARRSAR